MENQGKRLMLAVGIAFGLMMLMQVIFPQKKAKPKEKDEAAEGAPAAKGTEVVADRVAATPATPPPRGAEVFYDFDFDKVRLRFSSYDAALRSWELLAPRLVDRKKKQPENLIRVTDEAHSFLRVWFEDSTIDIPAGSEWKGEKVSDRNIQFTWEDAQMRVIKDIEIHPEEYTLTMNVSVDLLGAPTAKQALAVSFYSQQDKVKSKSSFFSQVSRKWTSACFYGDEIHTRSASSLAKKGKKLRTGSINWGGFDYAYFLVGASVDRQGADIGCNAYPLPDVKGGMQLDLVQAHAELAQGQPGLKSSVTVYLGPKYRDSLEETNRIAGFDTKMKESVDLGFLAIIAAPLLALLNIFQTFVINWGLAIILLTLVVKAVTLPWTHKSMKSMKAMSRLKPELEKIKEKYKDDKQRQNVETMNLFKTNKVNPMSGCLPMLLQMPIWFALYRSLTVAGELYQAPFITGWIDDLTLSDPYYVMPVLLTGMMFLQTRLTPSTGTGAQQKVLMYGMPIMFGVFSFFFPAGLTLYIFTNTVLTALHHLYMHKNDPHAAADAAKKASDLVASETAAQSIAEVAETAKEAKPVQKPNPAKKNSNKKSSNKKKGKGKGRKR